jgi:SAM-dependent methyltransferase
MTHDDRARWDDRYRLGDWADIDEPAPILRDAEAWLEPPGLAVIAVDISWEGLRRLAARAGQESLEIHPIHADLESFAFSAESFDVIINSRFLLRSLFPTFRSALKSGGILLIETFNVDEIEVLGGDIRRPFALERGELQRSFRDFDFLRYEEGVFEEPEGERGLARLIARKP